MAPGALQIIIIVLLVMVLFGTGRIPTIMENLAKGINSFKKGLKEGEAEISSPSSVKLSEGRKTEEKTSDTDAAE